MSETKPPLAAGQSGKGYDSPSDTTEADTDVDRPIVMYKASIFGTWETFAKIGASVWSASGMWVMMGQLALVSVCAFFVSILLVHDPSSMKVARLSKVSQFLNVIVGLLLSFFLSNSMRRWYACVEGFLSLLDSVRNLQMQFISLGVPRDEAGAILRHAYASGVLLNAQLELEHKKLDKHFEHEAEVDSMWEDIGQRPVKLGYTDDATAVLDKDEIKLLRQTRDPPSVIWTWIAAAIGRLAQDGFVPAMPTPTYGRIMNLCERAHGGIREVRAAICVQTPWNYVQCLSALVHLNNAISAVILGTVGGLVMSLWFQRNHMFFKYRGTPATIQELEEHVEQLWCAMLYCFVGPIVYQALLLIGISLAQPFRDEHAKIPMEQFLFHLEDDMCDGVALVKKLKDTQGFQPPAFKMKEGP